jgi:ribosome-associated toxin RatA of RatAB toxin-antitoxin module
MFFYEAMQRIVRAFEARAEVLYGAAGKAST